MARRVFFSFHYELDYWRTQQVRNINAISGQAIASAQKWEQVKRGGDQAIKNWIDAQMYGKGCLVVLVGEKTSDRAWVQYEILKAWNDGKGVLGIHVNKLKDMFGLQGNKGANPFSRYSLCDRRISMSSVVPLKTPTGVTSQQAYASISSNLGLWIEDAIKIRRDFKC